MSSASRWECIKSPLSRQTIGDDGTGRPYEEHDQEKERQRYPTATPLAVATGDQPLKHRATKEH
jgi:hypothetical protein